MKIKPIAFTSIEEINNWLAKNFDNYLETKEFLEENLFHITDTKERAIASVKYSAERLFYSYYDSLKSLLILRNKDKDLRQYIDEYFQADFPETGSILREYNVCEQL